MERIGFIGLGNMGVPILKSIIRKHEVKGVYNRTASKAHPYAALDMKIFKAPWEVAAACDVIFVMLPDSQAVSDVMIKKGGLAENLGTGKIVVDLSTIHPRDSIRIAKAVEEKNASYLDAPVVGSPSMAESGDLVTLVGGDGDAFERVRPIMDSFSRSIFHLGTNGSGLKMKLVNNMLMGGNLALLCEAILLGEKMGLSREKQLEILSVGPASSRILDERKKSLIDEDFLPEFLLSHEFKDLNYALDMARSLREPIPLTGLIEQFYSAAMSIGLGNLDFSSVLRAFKSLRGRT